MEIESLNVPWRERYPGYETLVSDPRRDSEYLRRSGLMPNIIDLLGPVDQLRVLDAGCGSGWLFDSVNPADGWECDLVPPAHRGPGRIRSECQDVRSLTYADGFFDAVVSSLVLMWVDDLYGAFCEAFRVTKSGGRLIVGLAHPYFHRNGRVLDDGSFLIERSLAVEAVRHDVMISGCVGPLTYFYRPLVQYYNEALAANWQLVSFRDQSIDMARYSVEAADRTTLVRRTGRVPLFTFFVCQKPAELRATFHRGSVVRKTN